MITIRLARGGAKKAPFYHIVVTDSRKCRDSGYKERLGYFNPVARGQATELQMDKARVEHWLKQGAKFTDRVAVLWKQANKSQAAEA
ncbi:MAG: 30S ribosomal protein S16 [Thiotrichales bacterium]